jgi:hypothetical protein
MALSATVNTLCYNPPMSHAGPKRPEQKAKPFAQAVPSAPPSLKVRKQQVVRAAYKSLDGPYNHVLGGFHIARSNKISKR